MTAHINNRFHLKKGFTLIELLIVMAILGVLAVVVLLAINPAEQLARTRDTGRVSAVTQIGHAIQAYYTGHNATYPTTTNWGSADNELLVSSELSAMPAQIAYSISGTAACTSTTIANGTWCYATDATDTIVYASLESRNYDSKCTTATDNAYILFSANEGKAGVVCAAADPSPASSYTFVP